MVNRGQGTSSVAAWCAVVGRSRSTDSNARIRTLSWRFAEILQLAQLRTDPRGSFFCLALQLHLRRRLLSCDGRTTLNNPRHTHGVPVVLNRMTGRWMMLVLSRKRGEQILI